jgi:hypothetical protein
MNPQRIQDLIHRFLDDRATPEEAAELSECIEQEEKVRHLYLQAAVLHAVLAADETLRESAIEPAPREKRRAHFHMGAIAAGVVIGALAVSAVWTFAAPRASYLAPLTIADAGFESTAAIHQAGVPSYSGLWAGDPCEKVPAHGSIQPRGGTRMVRFRAAAIGGDHVGSKPMASDLWQVVELPGRGTRRTVKVRAWFNAGTGKQARFHVMAVAGAGDVASAPTLWAQRNSESSAVLASCRAMVFVDRDPTSWEAGDVTLEVPAEARVLVVGLAAYRVPVAPPHEWFPAQFVDDVSVNIGTENGAL